MDVDSEIINYLKQKGVVRTTQLVQDIKAKFRSRGGIGEATIYRAIARQKKTEKIHSPTEDEVRSFGIKIEDGRGKFLVLQTFMERQDHLNEVFNLLDSGDLNDRLRALREIVLYKDKQQFTPLQLDKLVEFLTSDVYRVREALDILHDYILNKQIIPATEISLIQKLREVLLKFRDSEHRDIIQKTNEILGVYEDFAVIQQLYHDSLHETFKKNCTEYESIYLARVIEKNRKHLFNYYQYLISEDRSSNIPLIDHIREVALTNIDRFTPPGNIKTASEILGESD